MRVAGHVRGRRAHRATGGFVVRCGLLAIPLAIPLAILLAIFLAMLFCCAPTHAVEPDEILNDPTLEGRARRLSQELRCLVCQNQSIDDSNAALARDLRVLLRERLKAGDTDDEVFAFLRARYGEFVLLRPPFNAHTVLLWLAPFLLLVGAALALALRARARAREAKGAVAQLSEVERRRLDRLLEGSEGDPRPR
jgi:cytochrome c-type biogenesis protein CcmH